jgi:hypothetical protein
MTTSWLYTQIRKVFVIVGDLVSPSTESPPTKVDRAQAAIHRNHTDIPTPDE